MFLNFQQLNHNLTITELLDYSFKASRLLSLMQLEERCQSDSQLPEALHASLKAMLGGFICYLSHTY